MQSKRSRPLVFSGDGVLLTAADHPVVRPNMARKADVLGMLMPAKILRHHRAEGLDDVHLAFQFHAKRARMSSMIRRLSASMSAPRALRGSPVPGPVPHGRHGRWACGLSSRRVRSPASRQFPGGRPRRVGHHVRVGLADALVVGLRHHGVLEETARVAQLLRVRQLAAADGDTASLTSFTQGV